MHLCIVVSVYKEVYIFEPVIKNQISCQLELCNSVPSVSVHLFLKMVALRRNMDRELDLEFAGVQ